MTEIKTSLPFCLYKIDEREFSLNDVFDTKIKFIKKKIEPSRRTSKSQNIEFLRDRWGIDGYSEVEIKTKKIFSDEEQTKNAKKFTLTIINELIKLYRYLDEKSPHLSNLTEEDLIEFSLKSNGRGVVSFGFGGGISILLPQKIAEVSDKLEKYLKEKYQLPFWKELLLNAQYHFCIGDYRISILESIIALELVLSTFIKNECKYKGISDSEAKNYIKDIGLTGNIKISIRLLLEEGKLPEDGVFEKCKLGITIRNKIVHEGRGTVNKTESEETIKAVEKIIETLVLHGREMDELKLH